MSKLLSEQFKFFVKSKHDSCCLFDINKIKTVALNKYTQLFMVFWLIKQLEAKSALGTVELTSKFININIHLKVEYETINKRMNTSLRYEQLLSIDCFQSPW